MGVLGPSIQSSMTSMALFLLFIVCGTSENSLCQVGFFFEQSENKCKKCSDCPRNQIIKKPCSNVSDLECGPFTGFIDFPNFGPKSRTVMSTSVLYEEVISSPMEEETEGLSSAEKEMKQYQTTLTFVLIGFLSTLIIIIAVAARFACHRLQREGVTKQPDDGDTEDADSGYVVIRSIQHVPILQSCPHEACSGEEYRFYPPLLTSISTELTSESTVEVSPSQSQPIPGQLYILPKVYQPQRRLLNYDADDVFESDDNGGPT